VLCCSWGTAGCGRALERDGAPAHGVPLPDVIERPFSVIGSLGLVLVCGAAAAAAALAELGTCFSQTGDSSSPDTKVAVACASSGAESIFNTALMVGVAVAIIGIAAGYITGSRRTAIIAVCTSLAIIAIDCLWGFATKDVITSVIGPAY
jgi:hypothetical protein